jgi:hypothetical protein
MALPAPSAPSHDDTAPELVAAFTAWNEATNRAASTALEALYAPHLSLYGRIVGRADALKRKLAYVAEHPGFRQSVARAVWEKQGEDHVVRFRKSSQSDQDKETTVDAYLLWRKVDGRYLILDEGDVVSTRKLQAKLDALRANWKPVPFACPSCSDPDFEDEPPIAGAPLGPDAVNARGSVPPGAPSVVKYGRVIFPRFASAVDVPLFLTATHQATNGDGRWFFYDAPDAAAKAAPGQEPEHLLYCTIGGFWANEVPPKAKPDLGHVGDPKISFTTLYERRDGKFYYERYIYGADRVENYVYCSFSFEYEAYFYAIVQRMGHSMRAVSGGQAERQERESLPYVPSTSE